jgi:hypothetical protein
MVQEAKKKTVHMEGTWKLESTSVGLHPCEASIQKQCEGYADTANLDYNLNFVSSIWHSAIE